MILPYQPSPKFDDLTELPRWRRLLVRGRFLLAGVYFLALLVLLWARFRDQRLGDVEIDRDIIPVAMVSVVFFGMQALLLSGAPHFRWPRPTRKRWMYVSLATGALMAGLLTAGFVGVVTSAMGRNLEWLQIFGNSGWLALAVVVGGPWIFWLWVFVFLWSGPWLGKFRRMYRLLLAGTWLEMLVTIPVDVAVRRRTTCYCGEGTFFSMVIGITMIFWTFGPGVVLLFFNIRGRRQHPEGICAHCGYDLRGLPESRCPECGTRFDK